MFGCRFAHHPEATQSNIILAFAPSQGGSRNVLEHVKNNIILELNALFANAVVDEMAGDMASYQNNLAKIAQIAEILDINTEIVMVSLNLKE